MKMKKMLSLLISLLILVSSMGVFTASAAVTPDKTINLGVGAKYVLPTEIVIGTEEVPVEGGEEGETTTVDVTAQVAWKNAAAEDVTEVDTTVVGSRLYTGTYEDASKETVTLTYRANIGEYVSVLKDTMETHQTAEGDTAANTIGAIQGGKLTMPGYNKGGYINDKTNEYNQYGAHRFVQETTSNKVMSVGPATTGWQIIWTPSENMIGGVKVSMKIKAAAYDVSGTKGYIPVALRLDSGEPNLNINRIYYTAGYTDEETGEVVPEGWYDTMRVTGPVNSIVSNPGNIDVTLKNVKTYNENNVYSSDWYTLDLVIGNETMDVYSNGELMAAQMPAPYSIANDNVVKTIVLANRNVSNAETYFDDVEISKLVHYNGDIPTAINVNIPETDLGEDAVVGYAMQMSDGSTKTFDVTFDATEEEGGTATGTIEGFDGTVTVNYTVAAVSNETINTHIGATVTLADGTTITPDAMGRLKRSVTTTSGIINYTINVGRYDLRHYDNMESHTAKAATDDYYEGVTAGMVSDGFTLKTKQNVKTATEPGSAVVRTTTGTDGNSTTALCYEQALSTVKTDGENLKWSVLDTFDGAFKVSLDLKYVDAASNGASPIIRLFDTNGKQITTGLSVRLCPNSSTPYLGFVVSDGGISNKTFARRNTLNASYFIDSITFDDETTTPSTGWFTVSWIVSEDSYDVLVNDVPVYEDVAFNNSAATANLGSITACNRQGTLGSYAYFDNLEVYEYSCFTGDLPESIDVEVGQNVAAPQKTSVALTLSNGGAWNPEVTVNVDSSKLGNITTAATIAGFDETIPANVKVCNYHVDTFGYKNGNEFATGMTPGGTIASANFTNKGGKAGGEKALFAWYNAAGAVKAIKVVTIPAIEQDETETVAVNLVLPEQESDVTGGTLKVFIMNSMDSLAPIDIVTEAPYIAPEVPSLFIAAASTYSPYGDYYFPRMGIGEAIGNYVDGVTVVNEAVSGSYTQSFIDNGYWNKIKYNLEVGDYVLIALGHNDQGKCGRDESTGVVSDTDCVYTKNVEMFITDAQAAGANVILATPIARLTEGYNGQAYGRFNNEYAPNRKDAHDHMTQLEELSEKYGLPFVDMANLSQQYIIDTYKLTGDAAQDIGMYTEIVDGKETPYYSNELYMNHVYSKANEGANTDYASHALWAGSRFNLQADYLVSNAKTDYTHVTFYGANVYADMLMDAIKANYPNIVLSGCVNTAEPPTFESIYNIGN